MRRFIALLIATLTLGLSVATAGVGASPSYCGNTAYDLSYRAVYQYPSGTYWQSQISSYPAYYAQYNAFYTSYYGC